jgi:predicted RNA-binding protein with PUA-like domain
VSERHLSRYWLFATDPSVYHWDTLFVKGKELWNHIRSDAALRYFKQVRRGDHVLCYHGPRAFPVRAGGGGLDPYPDPYARGKNHLAVDLKAVQRLPRVVPFKEMKANRILRRMKYLARPRVAVAPVTEAEYNEVLRIAGVSLGPFR